MFGSTVGTQLFALLRNIIIARILGPHEFGIAAIVILTVAFLGAVGSAGPQNLLIQAKDEDRRPLLGAAHAVTLVRGVVSAALLIALAAPLTTVLGLQLGWPAVLGLAASTLISGLLHHGPRMAQRDGDFRLEALALIIAEFAALLAGVAAALILKNHLAIVVSLLVRSLVLVVVSHFLAPERYALHWNSSYLSRFWMFGWPLMINGPLLFLSAQADRIFISHELGMEMLGIYSAVMVLILSPSTAVLRWLGTNYTPSMAKMYHATGSLETKGPVFAFSVLFLVTGYLMFLGFAVIGYEAVHFLYGSQYVLSATLVGLIGALQVVRFLRSWTSALSISMAANQGILVSSIVRLVSFPLAYVGHQVMGGLGGLLAGFIAGEFIALIVSQLIVNRNAGRRRLEGVEATLTLAAIGAVVLATLAVVDGVVWRLLLFAPAAFFGAVLLCVAVSARQTNAGLKRAVRRLGMWR